MFKDYSCSYFCELIVHLLFFSYQILITSFMLGRLALCRDLKYKYFSPSLLFLF